MKAYVQLNSLRTISSAACNISCPCKNGDMEHCMTDVVSLVQIDSSFLQDFLDSSSIV